MIVTIVRRSASHAFPDALRPLATQSVETCIPTLEREERSSQLSCDAPRRMPLWTLSVLLATLGVATCITTLERGNENPTIVRRSASHAVPDAPRPLGDAERRDLHYHAGAWERESQLSCVALRRMPFRTLRVLFAR